MTSYGQVIPQGISPIDIHSFIPFPHALAEGTKDNISQTNQLTKYSSFKCWYSEK